MGEGVARVELVESGAGELFLSLLVVTKPRGGVRCPRIVGLTPKRRTAALDDKLRLRMTAEARQKKAGEAVRVLTAGGETRYYYCEFGCSSIGVELWTRRSGQS